MHLHFLPLFCIRINTERLSCRRGSSTLYRLFNILPMDGRDDAVFGDDAGD